MSEKISLDSSELKKEVNFMPSMILTSFFYDVNLLVSIQLTHYKLSS